MVDVEVTMKKSSTKHESKEHIEEWSNRPFNEYFACAKRFFQN